VLGLSAVGLAVMAPDCRERAPCATVALNTVQVVQRRVARWTVSTAD
jgi:hypothetical protein